MKERITSFFNKHIYWILAILLYLPTTIFVSTHIYLLFLPLALIKKNEIVKYFQKVKKGTASRKLKLNMLLIISILLLITYNSILGGFSWSNFIFGPVLLFPLAFLIAYIIADQRVLKVLFFLIFIESVICIVQYIMGVSTFFTSLEYYREITDYSSFYNSRVFGLSENSSNVALKSLILILLLYRNKVTVQSKYYILYFFGGLAGILLSFGRTTIIVFIYAVLLYFLIYLVKYIKRYNSINWINGTIAFFITAFLISGFIFTKDYWSNQFNRGNKQKQELALDSNGGKLLSAMGTDNLEMSGRKELWTEAINFISENPWWGNRSKRYYVKGIHVHNSFLEFMATHGVVVFLLLMCLVFINIQRTNIFFVSSMLLFSVGQFGVFWDISFQDVLFWSILFFGKFVNNEKEPAFVS